MKVGYSYGMKQIQKLAMTKEMQLSINILQMSTNELNEFMNNEFIENPVIEVNESFSVNIEESDFNQLRSKSSNRNSDISPLNFISTEKSLRDYLHEEILETEKDIAVRRVADYLVECLDDNGYFKMIKGDIAKKLSVDIKVVDEALALIQSLEPHGIGARDLKECLLIQLRYLGIEEEKVFKIVENNLEDIGKDDLGKISRELKITKSEAQKYSMIIKNLEPRPSRGFYTGEDYKYIIPDAEIRKQGEDLEIIINEQSVPKFMVSSTYKKILNEGKNKEIEQYVKDKVDRAEFLIKSIGERKNTLKRILEYIVIKQYNYFIGKENYTSPMTIKEIAKDLGYSESTVSRAIKNKFILTTFGVIRIKDLFTINAAKNVGNDMSVDYIKSVIEKLISEEDKKSPLSDQEIVEKLKDMKIDISRRTVAKYREEKGIKSSRKRKIF